MLSDNLVPRAFRSSSILNQKRSSQLISEDFHEILQAANLVSADETYGFQDANGNWIETGLKFLALRPEHLEDSTHFNLLRKITDGTTLKLQAASKSELPHVIEQLQKLNEHGYKINWLLRGGYKAEEVKHYQAVTLEIDGVEDEATQLAMFEKAGLLDRFLLVYHGGNHSIYAVGIFDTVVDVDAAEELVKDLCLSYKDKDTGKGFDKQLATRTHVSNAPFFRHTKPEGRRGYAYILRFNPTARLNFDELRRSTPYHELPRNNCTAERLQAWIGTQKKEKIPRELILKKISAQRLIGKNIKYIAALLSAEDRESNSKVIKTIKATAKALLSDGVRVDFLLKKLFASIPLQPPDFKQTVIDTLARELQRYLTRPLHRSEPETFISDLVVEEQFAGDFLEMKGAENKTLVYKGIHGCGKTEAAARVSKHYQKLGYLVIAVTYRRTLSQELGFRLELELYDDPAIVRRGLYNVSHVFCIDSAHKLDMTKLQHKNFIVIMDEATATLWHSATADTEVKHYRLKAWETLLALLNLSKGNFILDADMTNGTVEWLKSNVEGTVKVVHNIQKPKPLTFIKALSDTEPIEAMKKSLKNGARIANFSNCEKEIVAQGKQLEFWCKEEGLTKSIKTLTANTNDDPAFITKINEQVQHYDVFNASPVISTGVDIKCRHFDEVCGTYSATDFTTANDIMQQLRRVRYAREGKHTVYIERKSRHLPTTKEEIEENLKAKDEYKNQLANYDKAKKCYVTNESLVATHKSLLDFIIQHSVYRNKSMNNLYDSFWSQVKHDGHHIDEADALSDEEEKTAKAIGKAQKKAVKQEIIERIYNAPVISHSEATKLMQTKERSAPEEEKLERYLAAKTFGLNDQELTIEDIAFYQDRGKAGVYNLELLQCPTELLEDKDFAEVHENACPVSDRILRVRQQRLLKLIPPQVLAGEKFSAKLLTEWGFTQTVKDNAPEFRVLFPGMKVEPANPTAMIQRLIEKLGLTLQSAGNSRVVQRLCSSSIEKNKDAEPKRERFHQVIAQSLERMNSIMQRTNAARLERWKEYTLKETAELNARFRGIKQQLNDGTMTPEAFDFSDNIIQHRLILLEQAERILSVAQNNPSMPISFISLLLKF